MQVMIPISVGELCDRLTILVQKTRNINDPDKVATLNAEYEELFKLQPKLKTEAAHAAYEQLEKTNRTLWQVEDKIRDALKSYKNDPNSHVTQDVIVGLSARIIALNGQRTTLKNQISSMFGSGTEIKEYR